VSAVDGLRIAFLNVTVMNRMLVTAPITSAVFVKDVTFEEPMHYPQGANTTFGACKPTS
jgi:hypothetical protein